MSDQQRKDWEAFTAAQHAKGLCEFSGMRVSRCVGSVCDCFETPEGAAKIERQAVEQRELAEKFANAERIREAAIDELTEADQ